MEGHIVVINPNSNPDITERIDESLAPLRFADGPQIICRTLDGAPLAIESEADSAAVVAPLCELIRREDNTAAAFVVACFSDPGLYAAREVTNRPVFGIAQAGLTVALNLGERIGLIHNFDSDLAAPKRYTRGIGIEARIAGDRGLNVGVTELSDEDKVAGLMMQAGRALKHDEQADVLVFGCAGMTRYRAALESELDIPVIDPTLVATGLAFTAARFDYHHASRH